MATQPIVSSTGASFAESFEAITDNVGKVLQGKREAVRMALCCLVAEGHLLVEDIPGVGKTSLAKALAASIACRWQRVQFTPDLLPTDLTGVTVYLRSKESFEFRPGGIFANLVLADEINRASPKTQSALLEAMEERQVTVDGTTYPLPSPFMVIATQNPLEHVGTYPLPDSQLDRFLMRIALGYPQRSAELEMLEAHGRSEPLDYLRPVAMPSDVAAMVELARSVHVAPALAGYLVDVAEATRRHGSLAVGISPRATLALQRAARTWAAMEGRDFAIPDDAKAVAGPVLSHRLALSPEAHGRVRGAEEVLAEIFDRVPVPVGRPRA